LLFKRDGSVAKRAFFGRRVWGQRFFKSHKPKKEDAMPDSSVFDGRKELLIAFPVLGSALAMTYDVGYFWALDGICTKS
jgi:hypothetical protein